MIRPQHQKQELNTHGYLNFRWYIPVWILQTYSGFPPSEKEDHLPKNLHLDQSQLCWITQNHSHRFAAPFPAPSALAQVPSPRHVEPPAPCTELAPASWDCPSSSSAVILLHWRWKTVHRAGKRKISYKNRMGRHGTLRCAQSENACLLYASSTELSCHKSSNMSLSSCFLRQPQKQTKKTPNTSNSPAVTGKFARGFNVPRGNARKQHYKNPVERETRERRSKGEFVGSLV